MSLTGVAFLLSFLAAMALAFAKHPRFGLYAYLAIFYLDPPHRWWGSTLPDLRWSLTAGVLTLLATLRLPHDPKTPAWFQTTPAKLLLGFTAWMWIQNLWALLPAVHLEASILFTKYLILFYLIYRIANTIEELKRVLFVHVIGCAYLGLLVYQAPSGGRLEGVGGPGIDEANALGMFVATGILATGIKILEGDWRQRLACVLMIPFTLNALIQTESRGSALALVCGGLVVYYLAPKGYRKLFYVAGALGVVLLGYLAQDAYWERMNTLKAAAAQSEQIDGSAESRIYIAAAQLRMFNDHPLGTGHRGTEALSVQYIERKWLAPDPTNPQGVGSRSSHNTFMSALVEQGIPGAIYYVALTIWVFRAILQLRRFRRANGDPRNPLLLSASVTAASCIVVFVAGQFTDYLKTEVYFWMLALLAVTQSTLLPVQQRAGADSPETSSPAALPRGRFGARAGRFPR